ncbi:alpha/beta fold hydrolase [Acidiphilium sp.]|uniref:alpha/beta fold hydrolase n=2 Tax=Acidiphilium sp. TaxID=527 RepID=UPI0025911AC3|nr:alpha/beta fold hydrolase [Acidiphilium sp.]
MSLTPRRTPPTVPRRGPRRPVMPAPAALPTRIVPAMIRRTAACLRLIAALALSAGLAACAARAPTPSAAARARIVTDGYFRIAASPAPRETIGLPYRDWLPPGRPRAVVLALHGFEDSRNAWSTLGPVLAAHGIAVYAPDQRGFGAAPGRGRWPGTATLVSDARQMAAILHRRDPFIPLTLMGESMGGAIAIIVAAAGDPAISSYVAIAPAVWGAATFPLPLHWVVAAAGTLAPRLRLTGRSLHLRLSDNLAALRALAADPLTLHAAPLGMLAGMVRMMGAAQRDCARLAAPRVLLMYGGHDDVIPPHATAACWRAIPRGARATLAWYPADDHLMLLDHERRTPIGDILSFLRHKRRPLPSAAATDAMIFLAEH